ncbi:MAG: DedA family protein [Gemmatimonadota bacterium]
MGFITLEGMGLPLPGEIVLLTAAALAAEGDLSIVTVVLAAWIGTIAGGTGGYWIGRFGGMALLHRHGHWVGMTTERLATAHGFFERNGVRTVIIARFVAILRMIVGIVAGAAGMSFGVFEICNAVGGLLWATTFAALGYSFGHELPRLERYLRGGAFALLCVLVLVAVSLWLYRRRQGRIARP